MSSFQTYYKMEKSSMAFRAPHDSKIMPQVLVKGSLAHSALGMRVGLPAFVCRCIQKGNATTAAVPRASRLIASAERIALRSALMMLQTERE
jgi:hypothetical protein